MFYAIVLVTISGYTAGITDHTKHTSMEACQQHIELVLKPVVEQIAAKVGVSAPQTTSRCSSRPL